MILLAMCLVGTALSYFMGVRSPGRAGRGSVKGWLFALLIGGLLAAAFYAFSALGLIFSFDSLLSDF